VWTTIATPLATIPNYNRGSLAKPESQRTSNTIKQLQPSSIPPNPKSAALLTALHAAAQPSENGS